jgi:uncharacterized protein (DUF362 family)
MRAKKPTKPSASKRGVDAQPRVRRRELLERAGVALSGLALGAIACSDDGAEDATGGSGSGGASAQAGGGANAGASSAGKGGSGSGSSAGSGSGASGSGSGSSGSGSGDSGSGGSEGGTGSAAGGASADGGAPSGRARVAIVHRDSIDEAVAKAIELAGGLDAIKAGDSVFIKLNGVSDRAIGMPGIRTSNELLAAVIKRVKEQSPGKITVGDRSARQFPDTTAVFANAGITDAALAAGADEVYPAPSPTDDPDAWMLLQPTGYEPSWSGAGGILCMRRILEADHLINVPQCKNHRFALFSMSMKCFIGAIGDSSRDPLHFAESIAGSFNPIGRDIAVLNQPFSPLMNVLDATTALINGGPQGDAADAVRASPGLVLASSDRVALDATGVSLIKLELGRTDVPTPDAAQAALTSTTPFMFPQIVEGAALGLGVSSADDVELLFDDVADAVELEAIFRS